MHEIFNMLQCYFFYVDKVVVVNKLWAPFVVNFFLKTIEYPFYKSKLLFSTIEFISHFLLVLKKQHKKKILRNKSFMNSFGSKVLFKVEFSTE